MINRFPELAVIKLSEDFRDNIKAGSIGTVVHVYESHPVVYEVEFCDDDGVSIGDEMHYTFTHEELIFYCDLLSRITYK